MRSGWNFKGLPGAWVGQCPGLGPGFPQGAPRLGRCPQAAHGSRMEGHLSPKEWGRHNLVRVSSGGGQRGWERGGRDPVGLSRGVPGWEEHFPSFPHEGQFLSSYCFSVPWPGMEPMPSSVKMQSPYNWVAREFSVLKFAKRKIEVKFPLSLAIGWTSLWLSLPEGRTNSDSLGARWLLGLEEGEKK